MSYQPPFDGNWLSGHREWPAFDKPPQSVRAAVMFIYAGAAIHATSAIIVIAAVRSNFLSLLARLSTTTLTPSQEHAAELYLVVGIVISAIIGILVWLWMASKNSAGRRWARILSTVFFAFLSLGTLAVIAEPITLQNKILPVAEWVVGLIAVVLLWQRESSEYFSARSWRY